MIIKTKQDFENFMWFLVEVIPEEQYPKYIILSNDLFRTVTDRSPFDLTQKLQPIWCMGIVSIQLKSKYQQDVEIKAKQEAEKMIKKSTYFLGGKL